MKRKTENGKRDARRDCRRAGFTLVEMLVVIVIILVLMGVVFKMTGPATGKQAEAETVGRIEKLKAAIEEFYAEYGQYPPVPYYNGRQVFGYEYPWMEGIDSHYHNLLGEKSWSQAPLFTFGLMSFLLPRDEGRAATAPAKFKDSSQWAEFNDEHGDLARDWRACQKWAPFLEGVYHTGESENFIDGDKARAYTNSYDTVHDGWRREMVYVSPPPHQSYLLFSRGTDAAYDANDPGNRGWPANKDNIYGDVGFVRQ